MMKRMVSVTVDLEVQVNRAKEHLKDVLFFNISNSIDDRVLNDIMKLNNTLLTIELKERGNQLP